MTVIERQTVITTKDSDGNTVLIFPVTRAEYVEDAVRTINGIEPDASGDVTVAGVPIGFEYLSFNPNIPVGSLPLLGGTYSRTAYADLWAWVQEQTGYLITEAEWQAKSTANGGNVPFYSSGDGSTTFRVPSLSCWVKGANGIEEVGSYLEAGLPNITGSYNTNFRLNYEGEATSEGALYDSFGDKVTSWSTSGSNPATILNFDASLSNAAYGASDTVQPPSLVGMWLVKAFGTVSNIGNQDIAEVSSNVARLEKKVSDYTDNVAYIDSFIVESWVSDDGIAWYRKYNNGWIEQGGILPTISSAGTDVTCQLNTPFTTTDYTLLLTAESPNNTSGDNGGLGWLTKATTSFVFESNDDKVGGYAGNWYACGK